MTGLIWFERTREAKEIAAMAGLETVLVLAPNRQRYVEWERNQVDRLRVRYKQVVGFGDLRGRQGGRCVILAGWAESMEAGKDAQILAQLRVSGIQTVSG